MTGKRNVSRKRLVDKDEAPELTVQWFESAELRNGGKLVRRGRPKGSGTKELVSLRLDKKALATFRATGPGWQVRINETVARAAKRLAGK